MLLVGYENHRIELLVRRSGGGEEANFELYHTLVGHEDWIRDVDVCAPTATQLLIASCSQDHYIRLWRLDAAAVTPTSNAPATKAVAAVSAIPATAIEAACLRASDIQFLPSR